MNDLYLKVANSQFGKNILEALNLPAPPDLYRSPDDSLAIPTGRVLLAGTKNNLAYGQILKVLDNDSVKLFTPQLNETKSSLFAQQTRVKLDNAIQSVRLDRKVPPRFRFIVFDASGLSTDKDTRALYHFLQPAIKGLKKNGKIVIIGRHPENTNSIEQAAFSAGLEGLTKSIAKEIGHKGATCNLIYLKLGSEKQIKPPLSFLLTSKSAFVSGQTLTLSKPAKNSRRINWHKPLAGKTALVTGAAQGIGEETARILARDGATVVCLDIPANEAPLKSLADEINGHALALDLSDASAPEELCEILSSRLGVVHMMVHNAGITRDKTLGKMPEHFWEQVVTINLVRIMEINKRLIERNTLDKNARIVCIASISGIAGNFGQTNYAFSKSGVAGYTEALSKQLKDGQTINAIAPGFIETKMTAKVPFMTRELGRRTNSLSQGGLPLDVAEAVALFCHPGSQSLNGNVLRVCGQSLLGK